MLHTSGLDVGRCACVCTWDEVSPKSGCVQRPQGEPQLLPLFEEELLGPNGL